MRSAGSGETVNAASNGPRLACLAGWFPLAEVTPGSAGASQLALAPQLAPLSRLAPESMSRSASEFSAPAASAAMPWSLALRLDWPERTWSPRSAALMRSGS